MDIGVYIAKKVLIRPRYQRDMARELNEYSRLLIALLLSLVGVVCFVGCEPPSEQTNGNPTADFQPRVRLDTDQRVRRHANGGPNGDLVGSPTGFSGEQEIVAASEFAVPKTPEELLAQVLRAIQLEDFDGLYKLQFDPAKSVVPLEKSEKSIEKLFAVNKMGFDKERWGIKQVVIEPMEEAASAKWEYYQQPGGQWVRTTPYPTHELNFQYDWKLMGARLSGYWIGEKDGTWYICTPQPAPREQPPQENKQPSRLDRPEAETTRPARISGVG